jgi:hypothetical protein
VCGERRRGAAENVDAFALSNARLHKFCSLGNALGSLQFLLIITCVATAIVMPTTLHLVTMFQG